MDIFDLSPRQLKRAAAVKERIAALNAELRKLLGTSSNGAPQTGRRMSAAGRRRIAAAQRARWAERRQAESGKRNTRARGKTSATANAARSAKMKAFRAKKKRGKKST